MNLGSKLERHEQNDIVQPGCGVRSQPGLVPESPDVAFCNRTYKRYDGIYFFSS